MKKKRTTKKKSNAKMKKLLFCLTLVLISSGFIYSGAQELKTTADIQIDIQQDKAESAALDEKREELEETKNNLTNPDYIEYIARGKYLVTKDGEQVFKFSNSDE